jgi:hypothetical protein
VSNDSDIVYFLIGTFVAIIFIFKMELLIDKPSYTYILWVSVVLFVAGLILHFTESGRSSASGALLAPFLSLMLFRFFRRIFIRYFKHEPRDTFFNWQSGLAADRFFNIIYGTLSMIMTMLTAIGMKELSKLGW